MSEKDLHTACSSARQKIVVNETLHRAFALACHSAIPGTLAKLALDDATALWDSGKIKEAGKRALASIGHSIGSYSREFDDVKRKLEAELGPLDS